MTVHEWRIHARRQEAGNDNINVAVAAYIRRLSAAGGPRPPKLWERLILLLSTDWETRTAPVRMRAGTNHSGWMRANRAGRTSSPSDVCPGFPSTPDPDERRRPRIRTFRRRRQFSKLQHVALDATVR